MMKQTSIELKNSQRESKADAKEQGSSLTPLAFYR
jgi:hypothetical protein